MAIRTKEKLNIVMPVIIMKKIVSDFPNYEVNNLGEVKNINTGITLKPVKRNKSGYLYYDLYNGIKYKRKKMPVHRLVAQSFLPNPENKQTVNHKNSITSINWLTNLEWATHSENSYHAFRYGNKEIVRPHLGKFRGDSLRSKKVLATHLNGEEKIYDCAKDAAEDLNISYKNVTKAARNNKFMSRKKVIFKYI